MSMNFFVLVMSLLVCVTVSQHPVPQAHEGMEGVPDLKREADEVVAKAMEDKFIISEDEPDIKQELEDVIAKSSPEADECTDDGHCFTVRRSYYNDYDCGCPTISYYYSVRPFTENGVQWYPVQFNIITMYQWVKIGRCLSTSKVCHKKSWQFTYQYCRQRYERYGFLVYRLHPMQFRYKYFSLPHHCYCPCGSYPGPMPVYPADIRRDSAE